MKKTMVIDDSTHKIETSTGQWFDFDDIQANNISLEAIAHALSQICRYGGHCKRFYSVAEHAVFVSKRVERQGYNKFHQLVALHHDDAEAYLGDIPRPLKPLLGLEYKELTQKIDEKIIASLGLNFSIKWFEDSSIKAADTWALYVESRNLMPSQGRDYGYNIDVSRIITPDYFEGGMLPKDAKKAFLKRHKELMNG